GPQLGHTMPHAGRDDTSVMDRRALKMCRRHEIAQDAPRSCILREQRHRRALEPRVDLLERLTRRRWRPVVPRTRNRGVELVEACPDESPGSARGDEL